MTKKLAGGSRGTAQWVTSVGNEYGQVLISVLTASEGIHGLKDMAHGLMNRYSTGTVNAPQVIYVDTKCCAVTDHSPVKDLFCKWPELIVRLDVYHYIRRIASGVTTDAHQLYSLFMAQLSQCIFEWDPEDFAELREAKVSEIKSSSITIKVIVRSQI